MRILGEYPWRSWKRWCCVCDSVKGGVVKCIAKLQEFKDRNAQRTLGQLTSDRMPVSSF